MNISKNQWRMLGGALQILGIALIILSAADYLLRWNQISSGIAAIGLILLAIGVGFRRRGSPEEVR